MLAFSRASSPSLVSPPLPEAMIQAAKKCRMACLDRKLNEHFWDDKQRSAWENGPCLGIFTVSVAEGRSKRRFGCDIAHCPRIAVDEDKLNQCNMSSWVELDASCELLRYREKGNEEREGVACSANGAIRNVVVKV